MISLIVSIPTSARSSPLLFRDVVYHVQQFVDIPTTLTMFLVCRSWYHVVDRFLLLADAFYYVPERYTLEYFRPTISPCLSCSLETLHRDALWSHVDVMVLKVVDTVQRTEYFPPNLTSLFMCGWNRITDSEVQHLSALTSLQLLYLSGCDRITDEGVIHLSKLISLKSLDLSDCKQILDSGVAHISKLTSLTTLYLSGCEQITNNGCAELSKLTSLTSLDL
eukprot:PhF_6_TR17648/c0_g1_i1/m.26790